MSALALPEKGRPLGIYYRKCELGLDLPAQFICDLKSMDHNLFPIFHPYRILWDDMVNEYVGSLEDPRYPVQENSFKAGELVLGHILSNGKGTPTPEGKWHIWRWCEPAGAWAHIIRIESKDTVYLKLLVRKLWLQTQYTDRYGHIAYQHLSAELEEKERNKLLDEKQNLMNDIYKVNSAIMRRVMDNFSRGNVKPTNPQKETITSYSNQTNKSRTIRPMTDREGGLISPEEYDY